MRRCLFFFFFFLLLEDLQLYCCGSVRTVLCHYTIDWRGSEAACIIIQSCVWACLANSSSFHVINFPCRLLDQQTHTHTHTHNSAHTALGQRHKNVHLALCTDDSTRQVKHCIVKFCGAKSAFYGGKTLDGLLLPLVFFFCPSLSSLVSQQRLAAACRSRTSHREQTNIVLYSGFLFEHLFRFE